ncbi:MAG: DNA/RNA non-specific endonuclease [Bacteroidetes bacterium]|nr:DNA/RNA non-specific endonuclease [Bacteroidota bacterium]
MKILHRLLVVTLIIILSFIIPACEQTPTEPVPNTQELSSPQHSSLKKVTVMENFEAGTKTAYAVGDVVFSSGTWTLNDALVGTSTSDPKNGTKSIRTRNSGKITMKFDRTDGASTVTVMHAKYGTDANSTWGLWYSTNSGSTWTQVGSSVTTSSTSLQTASFTVNITGTIRFEIRKTDGTTNRVNFDDFTINDYVVATYNFVENYEAGTKTSYAVADVTFSTGVWQLNDALVGTSTSDRKAGTKSIRMRNSGNITMKFDKTNGAANVSVKHAKFGTDANSTWGLWYSTNGGGTWAQAGASVTTSSTTLQTATFAVNVSGTIRFEIRKSDGTTNRVNFDDFSVEDYAGTGGSVTEIEPNNTIATANSIPTVPATNTGYISTTTDVDYFSVSATSGQIISSGLTVPSGVDYNLYLLNSSGATLASSTNTGSSTESITYNTTAAGSYYILISSTSGSSTTLNYTLTANVVNGVVDTTTSTSVHLTMGNPSVAVHDTAFPANYLMEKPQYVLSYNRDNGIPNWTAWHLNSSWLGSTPRQNDFRNDTTLPTGWYQVLSTSYSGSGYDRGHMCPSADRTLTVADNSATFLMTNMIPQAPNNNQGPWANLENYLRSLVTAGKELYIYSGGYGSQGTIDAGHVNVPSRTWKIIVVLDDGTNDLSRVTTTTRVIAVNMPNSDALISRTADWKTFRVSVDYIEGQTGFDFLSKVPASTQAVIESAVDNL